MNGVLLCGVSTKNTVAVPYMDYVQRIKDNPIAKAMKLANLRHNSDLSRLDAMDDKALVRTEKYRQAIGILEML